MGLRMGRVSTLVPETHVLGLGSEIIQHAERLIIGGLPAIGHFTIGPARIAGYGLFRHDQMIAYPKGIQFCRLGPRSEGTHGR